MVHCRRFLPEFLFRLTTFGTFPPGEGFPGDRKGRHYSFRK